MADIDETPNIDDKAVEKGSTALSLSDAPEEIAIESNRPPKPEGIKEFIGVIRDEMEIRKKDQVIREKESDNAHEYSMKALDLQATDLTGQRSHSKTTRRDYLAGGTVVIIFIIGFLIYCLQSGHEEIASKVIQIGGTALLSGLSGYFYGKHKGYEQGVEDDDSDN